MNEVHLRVQEHHSIIKRCALLASMTMVKEDARLNILWNRSLSSEWSRCGHSKARAGGAKCSDLGRGKFTFPVLAMSQRSVRPRILFGLFPHLQNLQMLFSRDAFHLRSRIWRHIEAADIELMPRNESDSVSLLPLPCLTPHFLGVGGILIAE